MGNNNSSSQSTLAVSAQISDNLYAQRMGARGDIVLKNEFMRLFMTSLRLCFCYGFGFGFDFFVSSFFCCALSRLLCLLRRLRFQLHLQLCRLLLLTGSPAPQVPLKKNNSLLQCKLFFPHAVRAQRGWFKKFWVERSVLNIFYIFFVYT